MSERDDNWERSSCEVKALLGHTYSVDGWIHRDDDFFVFNAYKQFTPTDPPTDKQFRLILVHKPTNTVLYGPIATHETADYVIREYGHLLRAYLRGTMSGDDVSSEIRSDGVVQALLNAGKTLEANYAEEKTS